jgi:hypothetical protein
MMSQMKTTVAVPTSFLENATQIHAKKRLEREADATYRIVDLSASCQACARPARCKPLM